VSGRPLRYELAEAAHLSDQSWHILAGVSNEVLILDRRSRTQISPGIHAAPRQTSTTTTRRHPLHTGPNSDKEQRRGSALPCDNDVTLRR
jgi:hypothetical protein